MEEPEVGIIGLGHVGKLMQRIFPGAPTYDKYRPGGNADLSAIQWCNSCLRQARDAPTGIRVTRPGEGTPGPAGDLPALAADAQLPAGHHFRSGGHA